MEVLNDNVCAALNGGVRLVGFFHLSRDGGDVRIYLLDLIDSIIKDLLGGIFLGGGLKVFRKFEHFFLGFLLLDNHTATVDYGRIAKDDGSGIASCCGRLRYLFPVVGAGIRGGIKNIVGMMHIVVVQIDGGRITLEVVDGSTGVFLWCNMDGGFRPRIIAAAVLVLSYNIIGTGICVVVFLMIPIRPFPIPAYILAGRADVGVICQLRGAVAVRVLRLLTVWIGPGAGFRVISLDPDRFVGNVVSVLGRLVGELGIGTILRFADILGFYNLFPMIDNFLLCGGVNIFPTTIGLPFAFPAVLGPVVGVFDSICAVIVWGNLGVMYLVRLGRPHGIVHIRGLPRIGGFDIDIRRTGVAFLLRPQVRSVGGSSFRIVDGDHLIKFSCGSILINSSVDEDIRAGAAHLDLVRVGIPDGFVVSADAVSVISLGCIVVQRVGRVLVGTELNRGELRIGFEVLIGNQFVLGGELNTAQTACCDIIHAERKRILHIIRKVLAVVG